MAFLYLATFWHENQAQDAPKTPQDARRRSQHGPRCTPDALKTPQDAPRTLPGRSNLPPRHPTRAPGRPKTHPRRRKTSPRRQDASIPRFWCLGAWIFEAFWPGGMREAIRRPTRDGVLDNSTQVCLALLQAFLDKVSDLNPSGGLNAQLTPP